METDVVLHWPTWDNHNALEKLAFDLRLQVGEVEELLSSLLLLCPDYLLQNRLIYWRWMQTKSESTFKEAGKKNSNQTRNHDYEKEKQRKEEHSQLDCKIHTEYGCDTT